MPRCWHIAIYKGPIHKGGHIDTLSNIREIGYRSHPTPCTSSVKKFHQHSVPDSQSLAYTLIVLPLRSPQRFVAVLLGKTVVFGRKDG